MENKLSVDDAIFKLLETCFSVTPDKAKDRIAHLLNSLYPTVWDYTIIDTRKYAEVNMWEIKVIWKSRFNYVATNMWLEKVEGGVKEHMEWTQPG